MQKSIIIVCTGNICRSPMAAGILKDRLNNAGLGNVAVTSMGIHGMDKQPATTFGQQACTGKHINISSHRSRPLVAEELAAATIIFTMERVQKDFIKLFFPRVADKIYLITEWPDNKEVNIKDPMNGSIKDYKKTFDLLAFHIDRMMPDLLEILRD